MATLLGKKILGLGDIGELARLAAASFGEGAHHLGNQQALVKALLPRLRREVIVLVRGSRCMAMEGLVAELMQLSRS